MSQDVQILHRNDLIRIVIATFNVVIFFTLFLSILSLLHYELDKINIFFISGSRDFMFILFLAGLFFTTITLFLSAIDDDSINMNIAILVMNICTLLMLLGVVL